MSKNSTKRLPMASTTKIMTGILAIELGSLDDIIEVPREATGIEGSSLYLKPGDRISLRDLVYSLLLGSANDAACAIAYTISGDLVEFVNLMNAKSAELGLENTHFDNPHGLDSDTHYTSCEDLARLTAYALGNDVFKDIVSTYRHSFFIGDKERFLTNHNKLLKTCDGAIGVKTGYTDESGRCLVSAAKRDGVTLISVTLNDPDDWADHKSMYDNAFASISKVKVTDVVMSHYDIPIIGSTVNSVSCTLDCPADDIIVKINKDEEIITKLEYNRLQFAPIAIGDKLGEAVILVNGNEVARYDLISTENAEPLKKQFSIFI
jgi:D-alanyl-D-alanine carboxypeptidase